MEKINEVLHQMMYYFGSDVRRINHALKVYGFATAIAAKENLNNVKYEIVAFSAILHDIGIHVAEKKYNSNIGKYQELEGPAIAKDILKKCNVNDDIIDRVCFIISKHHTYSAIDDVDFQILVEADFLVNFYEDEMSKEAVKSVNERYFKTSYGHELLSQLYL